MKLDSGKWWLAIDYGPQDSRGEHLTSLTLFNWLDPKYRFWGRQYDYYDGPIYSLGFWFFNLGLCWPCGWDERFLSWFFWNTKEDK